MYGKCRSLQEAREVFDNTADRNTFSWNLMTAAYIENGKLEEAAKLFQHMPKRDVVSWTTMISAYAQLGHVAEALRLFKEMPHRNVVSWTAMITAYAQAGQMTEAYDLFVQMPYRDVVAWNAVIAGYAQQGQLEEALSMFHRMPRRNIVSWTAMITGYAQHGKLRETLQLFQQMQLEGLMPDKVTFISIFEACANHAALAEGEEIHKRITGSNFEFDVVLSTAILNMYAKCGNLGTARAVFDRMPERNLISWNAMMQAYAYHGSGRETIQLFYKMVVECVLPNDITFATILSASSHAGLINEGYHFLSSISFDYGLTPKLDHYNCVIDLLGRAGRLSIAEELLSSIPYQPSDGSWTTLLGSCKISSTEPSYDHNKTL